MASNSALCLLVALSAALAQPKFEVASIKRCAGDAAPGERGGRNVGEPSPGRLNLDCQTVIGLINMAYTIFADGRVHPRANVPISGGPPWIESERYSINATVDSAQNQAEMRGPLMQALLAARFGLRMHRETKQIPVYALTVAKGGPKLPRFQEGSCNPIDLTAFPPVVPENPCPSLGSMQGPNVTVEAKGSTVADFCRFFLARLDLPVIDKTGLSGKFNFHLVYAPDGGGDTPSNDVPAASIFTALQRQLGLKLEKSTGPGQFLVIDHIERPSEN